MMPSRVGKNHWAARWPVLQYLMPSADSRFHSRGSSRRTILKAGTLGALGLSAADLFRLKAEGKAKPNDKSVILIWLDGGPSQFETYDPKPEAPSDYRGPWGDIKTNVPGIRLSEMLPEHAKHADKMAFIRSVHHDTGDHFAAAHWMLTGRFGSTSANKAQMYPSVGSCVSKLAGSRGALASLPTSDFLLPKASTFTPDTRAPPTLVIRITLSS